MEGSDFLLAGVLFLFAAVAAVPLASRLGIGAVLGYLLAGIAIGPWGLGFISDVDEILHFSELGVVFLMFIIGLELNPSKLWQLRRSIFGVGAAQVLLSAALLAGLLMLTHFSWQAEQRTTWGMILGFSGVNYTGWLYIAWLPGYLQAEQGFSLAKTGWVAAIPFLAAAVGMWVNGIVVDRLAKKGYDLAKTRKTAIVCGLMMSALGTLLVVQSSSPAQAVAFISMALFCVHFAGTSAWGLVQVMVSETKVASIAGIQNFGSFVFASFAPIVTGWVVDTTHSFNLALVIAACVTFTGALCYFFIVKDRIE